MTHGTAAECEGMRARLGAYVDGELSERDADRVAAHVAACHACSEDLDALMATVATLRDALPRYTAPDVLHQRVRAALRTDANGAASAEVMPPSPSSSPRAPWRPSRALGWPGLVAAGVLIAAASVGTTLAVTRGDGSARMVDALEASHVRSLMLTHLVDVPSSDRHMVTPWFAGKLDYAPTIPNLDAAGFPLVGGRLDFVAGRRVAVAAYRRRQHVINLYVWPSSEGGDDLVRQRDGYWFVRWRADGAEHWAVSDVAIDDLRAFERLVRGAR